MRATRARSSGRAGARPFEPGGPERARVPQLFGESFAELFESLAGLFESFAELFEGCFAEPFESFADSFEPLVSAPPPMSPPLVPFEEGEAPASPVLDFSADEPSEEAGDSDFIAFLRASDG